MARTRQWRRGITYNLRWPKHTHGIPSHLRVLVDRSGPIVESPTDTSALLLRSFPLELISRIFALALVETTSDQTIYSWTYSFIPVRASFRHSLLRVCSAWRDVVLQDTLSSRSASRAGCYLGATPQELATIREWFPGLDIRGCLLIVGDPNGLLHGPIHTCYSGVSAILGDPVALKAVEAIEWVEASTAPYRAVGQAPDLEQTLLEVCNHHAASRPNVPIDPAEYRHLLAHEIARLVLKLCSKILAFLSLFPNLETTELPLWVAMIPSLEELEQKAGTRAAETSVVQRLGEELVSAAELKSQFTTFVKTFQGLNLIGYPLGLFGVFLRETKTPKLQRYIGRKSDEIASNGFVEKEIKAHFNSVDVEHPFFHSLFDHLKSLSWRDISRFELVTYSEVVEDLLLKKYGGRPSLEAFSAIGRLTGTCPTFPDLPI
jgi:hypothetical protein